MFTRKLIAFVALLGFAVPLVSAQTSTPVKTAAQAAGIAPMKVGGDVKPPVLIYSVEPNPPHPHFHKPKPRTILIGLMVAVDGTPANVRIVESGGKAYDKAAIAAVKQYRFRPATLHGQPVPVEIKVEVNIEYF